MYKVYSFQDIYISFNHPSVGSFSVNGEGAGDVAVSYANDRTAHDVAADGSVMVSKIIANNGNITINVQQVSGLIDYLDRWFNYIDPAPSSEWAKMTITIRDLVRNRNTVCLGVSPQKRGDKSYQAQGQRSPWTLMAAEITEG